MVRTQFDPYELKATLKENAGNVPLDLNHYRDWAIVRLAKATALKEAAFAIEESPTLPKFWRNVSEWLRERAETI